MYYALVLFLAALMFVPHFADAGRISRIPNNISPVVNKSENDIVKRGTEFLNRQKYEKYKQIWEHRNEKAKIAKEIANEGAQGAAKPCAKESSGGWFCPPPPRF